MSVRSLCVFWSKRFRGSSRKEVTLMVKADDMGILYPCNSAVKIGDTCLRPILPFPLSHTSYLSSVQDMSTVSDTQRDLTLWAGRYPISVQFELHTTARLSRGLDRFDLAT